MVFQEEFPTPSGRAKLVPAKLIKADEQIDTDYPFVLMTGRQLEHWHTGSMTRRTRVLDAVEPSPIITMNQSDLQRLDLTAGQPIKVKSRRGEITATARIDNGLSTGEIFIPFCYHEAAANLLTNDSLDPYGKIPEFKYCAVAVEAA